MNIENKRAYFECMRILACGLVIFNHVGGYGLYMISSGWKQIFYMCLTMITRINVPIFFMISGALLLSKKDSVQNVWKKRIPKIVEVLLLFDGIILIVYKLLAIRNHNEYEISIEKYIMGFLKNELDGTGAYWYMYAYVGFLVMLPFLQRVAKELSKAEVLMLIILHVIANSFLPMINIGLSTIGIESAGIDSNFQVPFAFEKAFFYPLIGYYLECNVDINKLKRKYIIGLVIAGSIGIGLSNMCTYYEGITTGTFTQNYVQLFDYLTAIITFLLIKYIFVVWKPTWNDGMQGKIICTVGSLTLGIYMLDPILKVILGSGYNNWASPRFPTLLVSIGWILISMTLGGCITYIMKKIPGIRRIM